MTGTAADPGSRSRKARRSGWTGRRAEWLAILWLTAKGYRLLERRFGGKGGEIDLVMKRGRTVAFVEVKQRRTHEAAGFALDRWRLRRVAAAAERLALRYARPGDDIRIDALFIVPRRLPLHLPGVWDG